MLSDGNIITVGAERFRCTSVFQAKCHCQRSPAECATSSVQNVMKCDVDFHVIFYASVVLSSSTTLFQEIGECMTKATDGVGSIHDVLSRASLSSVFFFGTASEPLYFFFSLLLSDCDTLHRDALCSMFIVQKKKTNRNKRETQMLTNRRMWTASPQAHILLKVNLSCTSLKSNDHRAAFDFFFLTDATWNQNPNQIC